ELHAKAYCVVFRIVGVEALAVRHVHTPEDHGQVLPVVQSVRKSGAVPEHELITGSACWEISVVEKDARAPIQRSRHVPAARKLLQLNYDFPPGLRLRQDIRLFLSLA